MKETIQKNYKLSWALSLTLVSILALLFAACNNTNLDDIKSIPKVEEDVNQRQIYVKDIAYRFSTQTTFNSVPTKVPTNIKLVLWDNSYQEVDYYFFRKFNNWFKDMLFNQGIQSLGENGEALDCENYSMLYKSTMSIANYKSGQKKEIAVGLVVVRQDYEFAGIPANSGLHMLNLVLTKRGWFIFEPQTNEFILLEDYPNQEAIQYIIF